MGICPPGLFTVRLNTNGGYSSREQASSVIVKVLLQQLLGPTSITFASLFFLSPSRARTTSAGSCRRFLSPSRLTTHECTHLHSGGRVFRIGDGSQPHEASEGGSQRPDPAHRRRRGEGSRTGGGAAQAPREVALRRWRRRRSRAVLCGGGGRAQHAAAAARPRWTCRDAARKPAGDRFAAGPTFSLTTPNNGYCTSSFNLHFLSSDNLCPFLFLVPS